MKFRIYLSSNQKAVPFNYPYKLAGIFHSWLGPNDLHDMMSLYSIGWLNGGKADRGGLWFPNGAYWDIGIHQDEIAERLVRGILLKDFHFYGMNLQKVEHLQPPDFSTGTHRFLAGSPIVLRKVEDDYSRTYLLHSHPDEITSAVLSRVWAKKLIKSADIKVPVNTEPGTENLAGANKLSLRFDSSFPNPKTRLTAIKGTQVRGSVCPLIAEASPEALQFLWTVGAGELTGTGFGSLNHTAPVRNGT
ncbi:MAG: hypothetical protein LAT67_13020 [Balneolales bacterium]|nr:hypothetical protein [Balneolales bacterium]